MKTILVALLVVALVALMAIAVQQHREILDLRRSLQTAAAKAAVAAKTPVPAPPPRSTGPSKAVKPAGRPAAPAVPQTNATDSSGQKPSGMFANLGAMIKDPSMRSAMRAQQKMALDMTYGSLFKSLNLPTDRLDALKELLTDRQMAMMDAGVSLMSGDVPASERAQKAKELEQVKSSFDQQIGQLLGTEDYGVFKDYEQTQAERMQVNLFKQSLGSTESLTDQQEADLIAVMYDERQHFPPSAWTQNTAPDPGQFSEEKIADTLKQLEQMQAKYIERAAAILSPTQLDQFKKSLEQQRNMMVGAMKMAAQMFGQQKAAAPQPPLPKP